MYMPRKKKINYEQRIEDAKDYFKLGVLFIFAIIVLAIFWHFR